jgi:NADPH:quinone reductase
VTRAAIIAEFGGPESLRVVEVETPVPGPGQLLVRSEIAGMNYLDVMLRRGAYPGVFPEPPIPAGVEGAGTVIAVGEGVRRAAVGRRVVWTNVPGSHAELVCVPQAAAVEIPAGVSVESAVAAYSQGLTAEYLSSSIVRIGPGSTALVWAAAGGVGRLLTQLITARGARVVAVVSSQDKEAAAYASGADAVTGYATAVQVARSVTNRAGVDIVFDGVGGPTLRDSLDAVRTRGTVVIYGAAGGPIEPLPIELLAAAGSVFLTRPRLMDFIADRRVLLRRAMKLFDLLQREVLTLEVAASFDLDRIADAHRLLESRDHIGKVLLNLR